MKEFISVVSPVYGCSECLIELYKRLKQTIEKISGQFEIILVNDADPSNAWEIIKVQDYTIANFGIYNKKVIRAIRGMGDSIKYFPTMVRWVGFKTTCIDIEHAERENGKSSYSFKKLSRLALDIILSFSEKPLKLVLKFGLSISFISFIMGVIYLYQYLTGKIKVLGFTSIIISIWFLAGIIIFILGIDRMI